MDDLISSFRGINGTISQSSVIDKLVPLITDKKINEALFTPNDAAEFERWLSGLPIQKYRVIRPILGLEAEAHSTPIQLGDFQIDFGQRLRILAEESQFLDSILKPEDYNKLFIECIVSARDTDIALECADAFFYRFELIFRFLIGRRTDWVQVGIFSYRGAHMRNRFIISEEGRLVGGGSSWEGALQPFIFGHPRFTVPTGPFKKLFELITRPNNEFEKHIVRCAEWTGQAISEPNAAAGLVKAAIALEVLFSASEKGVITPSIMAQISESCAHLLGSKSRKPVDVEREVKRLYGVRSSVVHSGKDSVDLGDLEAFIQICREVVFVLLSSEEFAEIDNMDKLASHFRSKKYAGYNTSGS